MLRTPNESFLFKSENISQISESKFRSRREDNIVKYEALSSRNNTNCRSFENCFLIYLKPVR